MVSSYSNIQNVSDIKLANKNMYSLHVNATPEIVFISPGECRDSTNSYNMMLHQPIQLSISKIGVNGLDSASTPTTTAYAYLYAIFLIGDSSGRLPTAAIATPNIYVVTNNQPIMPTGYDIKRLIGYALRQVALPRLFVNSLSFGNGNFRKFVMNEAYNTFILGTASSIPDSIDLSLIVPQTDGTPLKLLLFYSSIGGNIAIVQSQQYVSQSTTQSLSLNIETRLSSNNTISYSNPSGSGSLSLYFQGFDYFV